MTKFEISVYNTFTIKSLDIFPSYPLGSISITTVKSLKDSKFSKCSITWPHVDNCNPETAKKFACALAYAARIAELPPEDFIKKLEYLEANKITTVEYSLT